MPNTPAASQTPQQYKYQEQHKRRLSYMPWLYFTLKKKHLEWATPWQEDIQNALVDLETVQFGQNCFVSPQANLFAEPNRDLIFGDRCQIAADTVIHGPITCANKVSINHHCTLDGGQAGIRIGEGCRIGAHSALFAFNHGMDKARMISDQPVTSKGITLGRDVWLGSHVKITDGVSIGEGAVIGMGSVVTKDIPAFAKAAGNPAKVFGYRD